MKAFITNLLRSIYNLYYGAFSIFIKRRRRAFHPYEMENYERSYDDSCGGYIIPFKNIYRVFAKPLHLEVPEISYGSVEVEVGNLYYSFVRLTRPDLILETGCYRGYSTCCIASALYQNKKGCVYTIDPLEISHLWDHSHLTSCIKWIKSLSKDAYHHLKDITFDMLILDSEHTYETVMTELVLYEPLLKIGGYIFLHDCLISDGVALAVKQLIDNGRFEVLISDTPRTHGVINPLRTPGLCVVQKKRNGEPQLALNNLYISIHYGDTSLPPLIGYSHRSI